MKRRRGFNNRRRKPPTKAAAQEPGAYPQRPEARVPRRGWIQNVKGLELVAWMRRRLERQDQALADALAREDRSSMIGEPVWHVHHLNGSGR